METKSIRARTIEVGEAALDHHSRALSLILVDSVHRKISKEVEEVTIDKRVIDPERASSTKHPHKWEVGHVSN